jgi:hypothetical protein
MFLSNKRAQKQSFLKRETINKLLFFSRFLILGFWKYLKNRRKKREKKGISQRDGDLDF